MDDSNEAAPSISDIVQMRAWKHALFTTYTLSLSYFESEILRPLLRAGCSNIWLIADAEGYRSSLLERRSMRVGQEYRLIPAALPSGVFHAKCVYLGGEESDLLLVGSGNVTFGGHGKNVEVFEALSPDTAASAFLDFAGFLEAVGSRPDIRIARSEWVDDFAARARLAGERGSDPAGTPPLRLVHPLSEPVIDQLPDLLAPHGTCAEAIVMSPYHDGDGHAVRELAGRLNGSRMSVAVTDANVSPFPFEDAGAWPHPVSPIRPSSKDKRFVHAKWYEFATDTRRLLLTGSINATRKALTTTDNVELGVLRCLSGDSEPLGWEKTARPAFKPQERMPSGLKENEIVYAGFDRYDACTLTGRIISLQPTEGAWAGRLIQADGEAVSFELAVAQDGAFSISSPALEEFAEMSALQIVMSMGEREARGWVHNEMFLSMSGRRRLTAGSLSRLMRREGSADDIEALLDYLSMQAEQHLRLFDQPVREAAEDGGEHGNAEKTVTVNIAELAPVTGQFEDGRSRPGLGSAPDQFDAAMARLRRMLLGHGRVRAMASQHSTESALAEEGELQGDGQDGPSLEDRARELGLTDFEREIARLIEGAHDKSEMVRGLLAMSLEVGMWMRIYRLNEVDAAHEFLHSWFFKSCRLARPDPERMTSLQQHVVTSSAVLFRLSSGTGGSSRIAAELHDSLERYFGGTVDAEQAQASLMPDGHAGFAELLSGMADQTELASSLSAILSRRTTRQQLADALALAAQSQPVPDDWEVFASPLGTELLKALGRADWQKKVRVSGKGGKACAFDYYSFSIREAANFERRRIGRCIHCMRFTVNVNP